MWEWLETISPCINVLRSLATQINDTLGSQQGSKHHVPDLSHDIHELMKSLRTHRVYSQEPGRTIEEDKAEVQDVLAEGMQSLAVPLREYNSMFNRLRIRRRVRPLIGQPWTERAEFARADTGLQDDNIESSSPAVALRDLFVHGTGGCNPDGETGSDSDSRASDHASKAEVGGFFEISDDSSIESSEESDGIFSEGSGNNGASAEGESDDDGELWDDNTLEIEPLFSLDNADDIDIYSY